MKPNTHELIICIVNNGFSDTVMEAAKEAGARGGTVLNARGTANKEAEAFFHIAVLHSLYEKAGLNTMGQGIAFALPVDNVVGLTPWKAEAKT